MKALNPSTGQFEEVYVKALDSLPVGTEVDFDGNASDIPAGWEQVEYPTVLYSDTTGSNENLTLSDSYTNYSKLKIYFYCNANKLAYFIQEIDTNINNFNLMGFYKASDVVGQLISAKFQMNGTSISYVNASRLNANITFNSSQVTMNTKEIYIYKVLGYKEV